MLMPVVNCEQIDVGTLIAIGQPADSELKIAIGCPDCNVTKLSKGPATDDCVEHAIHATSDPSPPSNRKVKDDRGVRRWVASLALIPCSAFRSSSKLWIIKFQVVDPRIASRRGVIRDFREGVVAFEADVVAGPLLESNLQRVVPGGGDQSGSPAKPPSNCGYGRSRLACGIWSLTY